VADDLTAAFAGADLVIEAEHKGKHWWNPRPALVQAVPAHQQLFTEHAQRRTRPIAAIRTPQHAAALPLQIGRSYLPQQS